MDADVKSQPISAERIPISNRPKVTSTPPGNGGERTTRRELDIHDYLEAAIDAGSRSRNVTITMVVACTLVFVAVINSLQNSWMLQRILVSNDESSGYVAQKLDPDYPLTSRTRLLTRFHGKPASADVLKALQSEGPLQFETPRERRYSAFYSGLWKSYIDNSFYVRVPFFGFALDANDIGIFAGIAFTVILLMMRFCLAREIENLRAAFHRVSDPHDRFEFYTLLSMRQVFTVPHTDLVRRSWFASVAPKAIWISPVLIEGLVALHDYQTAKIGDEIDDLHTAIIVYSNLLLVGIVLVLTLSVIRRMLVIDRRWDACWSDLQAEKTIPTAVYEPATFANDPLRWAGEHTKTWWHRRFRAPRMTRA